MIARRNLWASDILFILEEHRRAGGKYLDLKEICDDIPEYVDFTWDDVGSMLEQLIDDEIIEHESGRGYTLI